jgi:hypothetical protein
MRNQAKRIAGIVGALLFGSLDALVWLNGSWNKVFAKPLDLLAIPVKLLLLPFSLVINNQDDLMEPYIILTFVCYVAVGFLAQPNKYWWVSYIYGPPW